MVLTPGVFVALLVVIQQVAVGPNADIHHGKGREKVGSATIRTHLIHLRKHSVGKDKALCRGHDAGGVEHGIVVFEGDGRFVAAVGGKPSGRATFALHHVYIHTALPIGAKCQLFAVGTPYGMCVVGGISCKLVCRSARCRH